MRSTAGWAVVLLALPALLVPRGVAMSWCLCAAAPASGCCGGDVSESDEHEDDARGCGGGSDCVCCVDLESEDPLDPTPSPETRVSAPDVAWVASHRVASPPDRVRGVRLSGRAPPGAVPRAGLLAGALPLRI